MAEDCDAGRGPGAAEATSAEKVLRDLLEHLVDPLLPPSGASGKPPTAEQKTVLCKQMRSVVILYNYYYRKQLPQLEYLDHEAFCKEAVNVKPCLSKFIGPGNHVERVSLKKGIMDACNISSALYASRESVEIEGWPVSRIAIFLVDSKQEKCFLEFGSITKGVWSLMEIEVGNVFKAQVEHTGMKTQAAGSKRPNGCSHALLRDEDDHEQLALSMVEEKTGINHSNFNILESHVTYSLSREKTTSRLYIIKSMKPISEEIDGINMMTLVELQDVFTSLQGHLLGTTQICEVTTMVDYYHLLPYLNILSNWPPRQKTLNSRLPLEMDPADVHEQCSRTSDKVHLSKNYGFRRSSDQDYQIMSMSSRNANLTASEAASKQKYPSSGKDSANATCKPETNSLGSSFETNELPATKGHSVSGKFSSTSNKSKPYSEITADSSCEIGLSLAVSEPCVVDRVFSLNQLQRPSPGRENIIGREGLDTCSLKRGSEYSQYCSNGANSGLGDKVSMIGLDKKPRMIENKDRELFLAREASQTLQKSTVVSVTGHPLVLHSYSGDYDIHHLMASKKDELQEASLRVLQKKRDDLIQQLRHLEDESAQCEINIHAVRNDPEGSLKLELESIIEACNAFCSNKMYVATSVGRQEISSKGSSKAIFSPRSSCKELDDVCRENNWMLPRYIVLPSLNDGNFRASVTVKGIDFESMVYGNSMGSPCEARFSAASAMLNQLYSMTS